MSGRLPFVILVTLATLALAPAAFAETVVENPEAVEVESDPNDVTPPSTTDEARDRSCTTVCLNSGEDPYRCEEDCVFVTDEKRRVPACKS